MFGTSTKRRVGGTGSAIAMFWIRGKCMRDEHISGFKGELIEMKGYKQLQVTDYKQVVS